MKNVICNKIYSTPWNEMEGTINGTSQTVYEIKGNIPQNTNTG